MMSEIFLLKKKIKINQLSVLEILIRYSLMFNNAII